MNIYRYIVVNCEHTDSFDDRPLLCASFQTEEEAKKYVDECVLKSCKEFINEEEVETGLVQTFGINGEPNYGCVWEIIDTEKSFGFPH